MFLWMHKYEIYFLLHQSMMFSHLLVNYTWFLFSEFILGGWSNELPDIEMGYHPLAPVLLFQQQ